MLTIALCFRGCDAVAPVIHEWTYEAMAYDLVGLKGSTFKYESETAGGKTETKEHILDERDELWVSHRVGTFIATCPIRLLPCGAAPERLSPLALVSQCLLMISIRWQLQQSWGILF